MVGRVHIAFNLPYLHGSQVQAYKGLGLSLYMYLGVAILAIDKKNRFLLKATALSPKEFMDE